VGFAVEGGFVSAGHCGNAGDRTTGSNQSQGTFQASSFPTNDYSWVKVNAKWTPRGVVNRYDGSTIPARGSDEAPVGASICRSGSTSGFHCGTVEAKDWTVRYEEGAVFGLTRTNVCAEPGDSGGSFISGDQAQGVTSGGSGDCSSGGTTFFQPVNEILSAFGLTLVTS
jgi:streptogrisin C